MLFGWCSSAESKVESQKAMTTNVLVHIKNNMLKSLWNSKFANSFHKPIDDKVGLYILLHDSLP